MPFKHPSKNRRRAQKANRKRKTKKTKTAQRVRKNAAGKKTDTACPKKKQGTKCPENAKQKILGDKKVPKKSSTTQKKAPKKGKLLRVPKAEQKTTHNLPREARRKLNLETKKFSSKKQSSEKNTVKKGDTACPKSGAKNKAQRAHRTQDGNILETKSPQEKNSAAKKHRQK